MVGTLVDVLHNVVTNTWAPKSARQIFLRKMQCLGGCDCIGISSIVDVKEATVHSVHYSHPRIEMRKWRKKKTHLNYVDSSERLVSLIDNSPGF
jgi:hypothetical protein